MFSAKIIADSVNKQSSNKKRITSFELEYPRFIHSEFMTHRVFSRNAASSRAIPIEQQLERVRENPTRPIEWGKNNGGMQSKSLLDDNIKLKAERLWLRAALEASTYAEQMSDLGVHKQIVNRITEPFVNIRTVMTTTEIDNWWWLRRHEDAQPEIRHLADLMFEAYQNSNPEELDVDEWHLPYYEEGFWKKSHSMSLESALAISASCCAQVSYRKLNTSLDKAEEIHKKLIKSKPLHSSPYEHQATPIYQTNSCQLGVTHIDLENNPWSGNFCQWIQYRKLVMRQEELNIITGIPNEI